MGDTVDFKQKQTPNLYIVDDFKVILAFSEDEASKFYKEEEMLDYNPSVVLLDDNKEINVIKSGKVEVILWKREPRFPEQLSFNLTVREFISKDLKRFKVPSSIDILEDKGAEVPKR